MDIRVLGPVEVRHPGDSLRLPGRQHRLILGLLALEANHVMVYDRLIDLLWHERLPQRPRAVLYSRVSELKARLATVLRPENGLAIESRDGGYVMLAEPEIVDANRFRKAVVTRHTLDLNAARRNLRSGLALWRGRVLGDGVPDRIYRSYCLELEAMRISALEDLFELELQVGNYAGVVDEIVAQSAANPARERMLIQAMLALERTGRTAEALQAYDHTRRWLREELGTEPRAEARDLYVQLLRGQPLPAADAEQTAADSLDRTAVVAQEQFSAALKGGTGGLVATQVVPRTLPSATPDFVGREGEIDFLVRHLMQGDERIPVAAVVGRGGVGKSALCTYVARELQSVYEDGQLHVNLRGFDDANPVTPFAALGRFLRALGVDGAALPDSLEERVDLYRQLSSDRRLLVVLDNAATEQQALPLIPAGNRCGVIINSRSHLGVGLGAKVLTLGPLDDLDAVALLASIAGADHVTKEPAAVANLAQLCGNLPLAIRIVAGKLTAKPHWSAGRLVEMLRDERRRLDHLSHGGLDVRASIVLSYRGLSDDAKLLLRRLGLIDLPEYSSWVAAAALDSTCERAVDILEGLLDAQLVEVSGREINGDARYRLHDLVHLYAKERAELDESAEERRNVLDRVLGAWLYIAESVLDQVPGLDDYAVKHSAAARRPICRGFLHELTAEPLRWFDTERMTLLAVVERAVAAQRYDVAWDLACTCAPLFRTRRVFNEWQHVLNLAQAAADRSNDPVAMGAVLCRIGSLHISRARIEQARGCYEQAADVFQRAEDAHGYAVATACRAMVARVREDWTLAQELYRQALPILRDSGDYLGAAMAVRGIGQVYLGLGEHRAADRKFTRALRIYRDHAAPTGEATTLFWRGMLRLQEERLVSAQAHFAKVVALSRRLGEVAGEAQALRGLGLCYLKRGDTARARETLQRALELVAEPIGSTLGRYIRSDLVKVRRREEVYGSPEDVVSSVEGVLSARC